MNRLAGRGRAGIGPGRLTLFGVALLAAWGVWWRMSAAAMAQDGTTGLTPNDVDGVEIKCRLDFGAKAIDWRGLYKNPGA